MHTFNLVDTSFAHDSGTTAGKPPRTLVWDRTCADPSRPTFYSNEKILDAPQNNGRNFGLLFESRAIVPEIYAAVGARLENFEKVFTCDGELLREHPGKCLFVPASGSWIGGTMSSLQPGIYKKEKLVSMVTSYKRLCTMHLNRLRVAEELRGRQMADVYVSGRMASGRKVWHSFEETHRDYMYTIVMENHVDETYFTEKLLNCFATGVVPVYCGASSVGNFFDPRGIISFTNYRELLAALPRLSPSDYASRLEAVSANYERSFDFWTVEDFIVARYADVLFPPWASALAS